MFATILTLLGTLLHGYLCWHILTLPRIRHGNARRLGLVVAIALWLLFAGGILFGHDGSGGLAAWLERVAMDWFGILFLLGLTLFTGDFLSLLFWRRPSRRIQLRVTALALGSVLVAVAFIQGARAPVVVEYEVALSGLPASLDGTRLAVLSDLHLGSQLGAPWLSRRAAQLAALSPDLIVLLGDTFEGHGEVAPALEPVFSRLKAPLGVYAVSGNHEHFGDNRAALTMTERAGVVWLRDSYVEPVPGLVLAGVDDLTIRWRHGSQGDEVTSLLSSAPAGASILLSHSPLQVEEAAEAGAELMLSGHTHGGQIWPFGYLVQRFYPRMAGRYAVGGMTLIVSQGTGLWGPRMRLWSPGEILLLRLRSA